MAELRVSCALRDCTHFVVHQDEPRAAFCNHPEKCHYMNGPCPLYKKKWNVGQEKALLERFRKPRS